jgi:hypothetical protein
MPKPSLTLKYCAGVRAFLPLPLCGYATHWRVGRHPFLLFNRFDLRDYHHSQPMASQNI